MKNSLDKIVPKYDDLEMYAIKALVVGEATPEQQKLALEWIIKQAANTYDNPYSPGTDGLTEFQCGRMFVGQQIVKLINLIPKEKNYDSRKQ